MTALEEYTAHHAESAEEIMYNWPWRRFEGMFRRHLLRKAREELRQLRDLRLAALDANMNFDSKENQEAKQSRLEGLQEAFQRAERLLYSGKGAEAEEDAYENDPLFAPLHRRAQTLRTEADQPLVAQAGMGRHLLEATG
jgi:formate dehydrogenase maturation protein FdhE